MSSPSQTISSPVSTSTGNNGDTGGGGGGPTSSPLLFFVALGFGVVFTNLWYVADALPCPNSLCTLALYIPWAISIDFQHRLLGLLLE